MRLACALMAAVVLLACQSVVVAPTASPNATPTASPSFRPTASPTASPTPTAGATATPRLGEQPTGPTQTATVSRVVDGDTIHVLIDGVDYRLRYIGMDTPEDVDPNKPVQPGSLEAAAENTRLVSGKTVVLEKDVSETDQFGRLLRYVWLPPGPGQPGWLMVDLVLVREGFAWSKRYPPDVKYQPLLDAAQDEARAAALGLWANPTPSP